MNFLRRGVEFARPRYGKQLLVSLLPLVLSFAAWPQNLLAHRNIAPPEQDSRGPQYTQQTSEQLQQLVAPIALYPDSLVAQILAASTFPAEVVEADRWVQAHPDMQGDDLARAVDHQPWDPSVKALTAFPSVLGNMDKNLSWTSSLGDAYYNQQRDVMDSIQEMRQWAQEAGNLKNSPQQTVTSRGSTITIEPANPDVVYVPAYDPWLVYGGPVEAWPGWYQYPGIWYDGPYLSFGIGFGIGCYGGYGWGWHHWGSDWHGRSVTYNHDRYYSRSRTFYKRNNYYRDEDGRGGTSHLRGGGYGGHQGHAEQPGASTRPFNGNTHAARGYAEPRGQSGVRSGAFSGYDHGGQARSYSSRGSASFGGGGFGGGGGTHGGGHR